MQRSNPGSRSPPTTMVTTLSPGVANPPAHPLPRTRGTKGPGSGSFENIKEVDLGRGPSGDDEGGREAGGGMRARPGLRARGNTARRAPAGSVASPACDPRDPPPATPPEQGHKAACVPAQAPDPRAAPRGGGWCLGRTPASRSIQGYSSAAGPCRGPRRKDHER